MYSTLILLHSVIRWLALGGLLYALFTAARGYYGNRSFTATDNAIRHWTATIAHIQLTIGIILYFQSPVVKYYFSNPGNTAGYTEPLFFSVIHLAMMFVAIVAITIGSAVTKRRSADREKFRTLLTWFGIAFLLIMIAIPWPFSPLAHRPYIRTF